MNKQCAFADIGADKVENPWPIWLQLGGGVDDGRPGPGALGRVASRERRGLPRLHRGRRRPVRAEAGAGQAGAAVLVLVYSICG